MESVLAVLVGILVAVATFLLLQRNLLRQIFGIMLLGAGVNLLILTLGRLTRVTPPLVPDGADLPPDGYANPLSQALILTAIVVGISTLALGLAFANHHFLALLLLPPALLLLVGIHIYLVIRNGITAVPKRDE